MKGLRDLLSDVLMCAGVWLIVSGGAVAFPTWPIVGPAAPFKSDTLAVLIVEETEQRTADIDAIEGAIQKAVIAAGGKYRRFDKDQTDLSKDEPWVADAWKAKGADVPWIVAANSRTGITQHLTADSLKALAPLGVK